MMALTLSSFQQQIHFLQISSIKHIDDITYTSVEQK